MLNILKYYKFWFLISGTILLFGIISLAIFGLKLGIDFKGGTLTEIKLEKSYDISSVKTAIEKSLKTPYQLQSAQNNGLILKTEVLNKSQIDQIFSDIRQSVGQFSEIQFESIGPTVGKELKTKAGYQLGLVSLGIILYLAYAFRRVTKPVTSWQFGWAAVIALLHDLLFVLGVFSLLGHFKGVEVDSLFVTAILTVLGFSVHDTIVVFDRIRENLRVFAGQNMSWVVNHSIAQTIVRSLNTSLTVLFVLLSLLLFGGETIRYFVLALFIGVIVGTYSSIFIASPILVLFQKLKK